MPSISWQFPSELHGQQHSIELRDEGRRSIWQAHSFPRALKGYRHYLWFSCNVDPSVKICTEDKNPLSDLDLEFLLEEYVGDASLVLVALWQWEVHGQLEIVHPRSEIELLWNLSLVTLYM